MAVLRCAIISAAMLTAISSGVSAWMGRPTGMWSRSTSSGGKPSSPRRARTKAVLRLLPRQPRSEGCAARGASLDDLLRAGWRVGVGWQDGRPFHGPCHIRMNLALPLSRVREAFERLDRYVFNA